MACNQLHFLQRCDQILYLENGRVEFQGTFKECMDGDSALLDLLEHFGSESATACDAHDKASIDLPQQASGGKISTGLSDVAAPKDSDFVLAETKLQGRVGWSIFKQMMTMCVHDSIP